MAQGDNLPARFSQNIQQEYWTAEDGSDTLGTGAEGAPWQTLNKTRSSIVNPGTGDVRVNMQGTLTCATDAQQNLLIANNATSPSHRWVFRTDPNEASRAVVLTPPGATAQVHRHVVRMDEGYCTFENFDVTQSEAVSLSGSGSSAAFWIGSGAGTPAPDVELYGVNVYGIDVLSSTTRFQPFKPEFTGGGTTIIENCRTYSMCPNGATDLCHGAYVSDDDVWFINCLVYDIRKGYGLQFFAPSDGLGAINRWKIVHCTIAGNNWTKAPITYVAGDNMQLRNSILWDASAGTPSVQKSTGTATNSNADHMIIRRSSGTTYFAAGGDFTQTNVTTGTTATNPFVDEANDNYHLAVGAEAIGYADTTYSRPYDIDGNPRPAGAEDAGAFQFVASNTNRMLLGVG